VRRCTNRLADAFRNRDMTIAVGPAAGLILNTGSSNLSSLLAFAEPDVQKALATVLTPGMTFYDIGANVGFYTIMAARLVGPTGAVASFEPLTSNLDIVARNIRANGFSNVTCVRYAIGEADGKGRFILSAQHSWGMLSNGGRRPGLCTGEIAVEVRRLDSLFGQQGLKPPDVIKMDIEGGEAPALAGAVHLLQEFRPILLIELHDTTTAVMRELDRSGYQTSLLGTALPVANVEGNVHMVAVPAELPGGCALIERLQDPLFPRCERCAEV
jgi:FkbM family methyltransferase